MARKAKAGMQHLVDFSALSKFVGAGEAMAEAIEENHYIDAVIEAAHAEVEDAFNVEAAAAAAAGTNIKHMFEWGTMGINRGRTNVRPDPLSERARLWTTALTGMGKNRTLTYAFKPSVAIVPKPTKRDTGMDTETIDSLRDHVFTWKAEVMETGAMVTIIPKEAKFLLIPYYPSQWGNIMFSERDIERGYTLSKGPHTHSPGDTSGTTGAFTTFWTGWWESTGDALMNKSVEKQIEQDFLPAITVNYTPNKVAPPMPGKFKAEVKAEKAKVKKSATTKARARRG